MKILFLVSGNVRSNFSHRALALAKALQGRGHNVVMVAPKADKYNNFVPETVTDIEGVRILQPFQFATKRLELNLLPYMFFASRMVLREKPDVVYIYKPTPITVVGLLAKLFRRTKIVLDMDDLGSEVMKIEGHPFHQRTLVKWCERITARYADAIVVASSYLEKLYKSSHPHVPLHRMPNGVEKDWLEQYQSPETIVQRITFMGALNRKNILEPLFDVLPAVVEQYPQVEVLIIGDGQHMNYFKKKVKALGLAKHVSFTGWLNLQAARDLLHPGDIGYNYMPDEVTIRAASNMKVPQYLASGVVPIVSDMGDLPFMVDNGHAGYVAKPDDPPALEAGLLSALHDPYRAARADYAHKYAWYAFDWDKLAAKFESWVSIVAKKKTKPAKVSPKAYRSMLVGLLLTNAVILARWDPWHLGAVAVGLFTLLVPGLLLLSLFVHKKLPAALGLSFGVGLSVGLLMSVGLLINTAYRVLDISHPLSLSPLLIGFDVLTLALLLVSYIQKRTWPLERPRWGVGDWLLMCAALVPPVLAVAGATLQNNNGSNVLTMVSMASIAGLAMWAVSRSRRLDGSTLAIVLYSIALSLLLMSSMRGWFITGHDVLLEYQVFRLTHAAQVWDMSLLPDAYNACLSITILPTYLSHFLHINDMYIYKFVFQFLAAAAVVPIFYLFRHYVSVALAFLATLLYVTFPTFMTDMAMLNRQTIAFMFYMLLLFVMLSNTYVVGRRRTMLLFILGVWLVLSHYSTSYVTIGLLMAAYVINVLLRFILPRIGKNRTGYQRSPKLLTLPLIVALIVVATLWQGPATHTSKNLSQTLRNIASVIRHPFSQERGGAVKYSVAASHENSEAESFERFQQDILRDDRDPEAEYVSNVSQYQASVVSEPKLPIKSDVGQTLDNWLPQGLDGFFELIKQSYARLLQVLLVIGLAGLVLGFRFKRHLPHGLPTEYVALACAGIVLIVGQIAVPEAIDYGLLRLFQQNLIIFALPICLAGMALVGLLFRKLKWQTGILAVSIVGFYIILSGFVPQLLGGSRPLLPLNNNGFYYDTYYTHAAEIAGLQYLDEHNDSRRAIQSDRYFAGAKMQAYVSIASQVRVFPTNIQRTSFVYLGRTNIQDGVIVEFQDSDVIYYTFPLGLLDDTKAKIYTSNGSTIYQ